MTMIPNDLSFSGAQKGKDAGSVDIRIPFFYKGTVIHGLDGFVAMIATLSRLEVLSAEMLIGWVDSTTRHITPYRQPHLRSYRIEVSPV